MIARNYGDEKPAIEVMFPEEETIEGVSKQQFDKLRSQSEVQLYSDEPLDQSALAADWFENKCRQV